MPPFARFAQSRAVRLVALSCFLTTMPVYSPNVMTLSTAETSDLTGAFSQPFLMVVTLSCALLAISVVVKRQVRAAPSDARPLPRALHAAVCALYIAGCAGYFIGVAFCADHALALALQPLFALLAGVAFVPVVIGWAETARAASLSRILTFVAVATCAAVLYSLVLGQLPQQTVSIVYLVFTACGSLAPLAAGGVREGDAPADPETRDPSRDPSRETRNPSSETRDLSGETRVATLRAFASVMGTALLGVALSSLVMAIAPTLLFDQTVGAPETGMFIAGLVLLPVGLSKKRRSIYPFAYQVVLPVVAAVALVAAVVSQVSMTQTPADSAFVQAIQVVALLAAHTLFALTTLLAVSTACAVSGAQEFSRTFVFCTLIGTFTLCAVTGIGIGSMLNSAVKNHAPLTLTLTFVYSAFVLLAGCAKAWRIMASPQHETHFGTHPGTETAAGSDKPGAGTTGSAGAARAAAGGGTAETTQADAIASRANTEARLDERIARVANEYGLTQREREILGYLGRGFGSAYVAKTLLISENTARTHIRNIHRKLGVSARDELLQLVSGADAGERGPTR